jgi:Animal haem peroxidase
MTKNANQTNHVRDSRIRGVIGILTVVVWTALAGASNCGRAAPSATDPHLDFFLKMIRTRPGGAINGTPAPVSQSEFERMLRILPAVGIGHGAGPPLAPGSQGTAVSDQDLSVYGFCYEACKTERAVGSCGTPAPGALHPPEQLCAPVKDTATLNAIMGPQLGAGVSPFVDDNTGPDGAQPAGYTFLGQFIDHDVTRTTTALSALGELSRRAHSDASVRAKLAASGVTLGQLNHAIADAATPGSALSANTGKLDLDSVYGVPNFAALTAISAPWFERQNAVYTGRFAMREVQAPTSPSAPTLIDGFDFERSADGAAEIPDPRNSEHKMLSQVQNLFELAHNDCVDRALSGTGTPSQQQIGASFDDCHKKVLWTYQTIVATDFLPRISAEAVLNRVAPGALHAFVRGATPASTLPDPADVHTFLYSCKAGLGNGATIRIPHEFAVAVFRLGHSLVRDDYVLHDEVRDAGGNVLTGQDRPIFAGAGQPETAGLVGDNPLKPGDVIDWSYFFDTNGQTQTAQPTRPLDTLISDKLFSLPVAAIPPGPDANGKDTSTERNLPRRNILRASEPTSNLTGAVGLATGEEVERYAELRISGLHDATAAVRKILATRLASAGFDPNYLAARTPLWLFILAEAEATQHSRRLGELGSHIVDEFLLGSLRCDEASILYAAPGDLQGWGPTATIAQTRRYSMPELIAYLQGYAMVGGQPVRLFSR